MKPVLAMRRSINLKMLLVKKNSPHIFFGLGLAGIVTSTVLACRATLKLSDTLDDIQKDVDEVKELKHSVEVQDTGSYEIEEYGRDATYVYVRAGFEIVKLYAPSIIIGGASIALLTQSHIELSRRNAALTAAYAVIQKAYDEYRERVRELVGEEKERELHLGVQTDFEGSQVMKTVDPNATSPYARFFDEYSSKWKKDPELNRIFIQGMQNHCNQMLLAQGHLFLNEVYDILDIPRSSAGQIVGWVIGQEGDNHVDFGMFETYNSRFMNGLERSILLDFNVDGVVYDKI